MLECIDQSLHQHDLLFDPRYKVQGIKQKIMLVQATCSALASYQVTREKKMKVAEQQARAKENYKSVRLSPLLSVICFVFIFTGRATPPPAGSDGSMDKWRGDTRHLVQSGPRAAS